MIDKEGKWVVRPVWDCVKTDYANKMFWLYRNGNRINVSYMADSIMKAPVLEFRGDSIFVPNNPTIVYVKQRLSK